MNNLIFITPHIIRPFLILRFRKNGQSNNRSRNVVYLSILLLGPFLAISCSKLVEVPSPVTSTNADIVYKNDASAISTLNNIYAMMSQDGINGGITSLSLFPSLSSDDLSVFNNVSDQEFQTYFTNNLKANFYGSSNYWINIYSKQIFLSNSAIEGLINSEYLTPAIKDQLLGEALFIRAFSYFYLVNLYGSVPLVLNSDYRNNSHIARANEADIYKQLTTDLTLAKSKLSDKFLDGSLLQQTSERISPTKWAASALLARVYLYNSDWKNAEIESSNLINEKNLFDTVSLSEVFYADNKESIWQLQSVSKIVTNTSDAQEFFKAKTNPNFARVYANPDLISSFETDDSRKVQWLDSTTISGRTIYFPSKYKVIEIGVPVTERTVILRLAEQYLIRSESRAQLGNFQGALDDLNIIRTRANLKAFSTSSKEDLLKQITKERRSEFFTEWGHRWLDLKRNKLANDVLKKIKGNDWQTTDALYPIPFTEIQQNTALMGDQNPGY